MRWRPEVAPECGRTGRLLRTPGPSGIVRVTLGPHSHARLRRRATTRSLAVCAALVALLAIALWPSRGFAAILPACESDNESRVAPAAPEPEPVTGSCESVWSV